MASGRILTFIKNGEVEAAREDAFTYATSPDEDFALEAWAWYMLASIDLKYPPPFCREMLEPCGTRDMKTVLEGLQARVTVDSTEVDLGAAISEAGTSEQKTSDPTKGRASEIDPVTAAPPIAGENIEAGSHA